MSDSPRGEIVPDPHAIELVEKLSVSEYATIVLTETLNAADDGQITESGRTICSTLENVSPPIDRYPMAVDLPGCRPWDATGIIHSHVTPDELRNPTHSLPDVANVLYGNADASIVPGAESTHAIVRPTDETIPEARAVFDNVIGQEIDRPEDVSRAVDEGAIISLESAQSRLMEQLGPITDRFEIARPQIIDRVAEMDTTESERGMAAAEMAFMRPPEGDDDHRHAHEQHKQHQQQRPAQIRACSRQRDIASRFRGSIDDDTSRFLKVTVVSNVIGTIVGGVVTRAVFGD